MAFLNTSNKYTVNNQKAALSNKVQISEQEKRNYLLKCFDAPFFASQLSTNSKNLILPNLVHLHVTTCFLHTSYVY